MSSKTINNPIRTAFRGDLKTWVKTTRIQTAMVTALSLWIGHITVAPLTTQHFATLGVIGVLIHIWGFTLNEIKDAEYDKVAVDVKGHPIAQGDISKGMANFIAWSAAFLTMVVSIFTFGSSMAMFVLMVSFIPGLMYDYFSKEHWWSGSYLSIWTLLMVLVGAYYAGTPTLITLLIAAALSIQIFVQVIEGDLKDLEGNEPSLTDMLGVRVKELEVPEKVCGKEVNQQATREDKPDYVLSYTKTFKVFVYALKSAEATLLASVVLMTLDRFPANPVPWLTLFFVLLVIFMVSNEMWLVNIFDRDTIKKESSKHELTSVMTMAVSVAALDMVGAILIGVAPVLWYAGINVLIHSSALVPDV